MPQAGFLYGTATGHACQNTITMEKLKIAIQKSGRLNEDSLRLLRDCGISINNGADQLMAQASNFPLEVLYLRNSDIPQYVRDGVADIAVIGSNTEYEKQAGNDKVLNLGFSRCHLSMAVPKNAPYDGLEYFNGRKIATSYPNSLRAFLRENNIDAEIHEISGSVEIAPGIGLADGICDLVSSGSTLFKNGLREVHKVLESEAILVANPDLNGVKRDILDQLVFRIKSVLASRNNKYILLNAPESSVETISALLPGMKSPTVLALKEKGWVSIHSVVSEDRFWEVIGKLKDAGATGILVIPIEKMIL